MFVLFGHPIGVKAQTPQTPQTRNGSIQVSELVVYALHRIII
jgi:hypothetical protein